MCFLGFFSLIFLPAMVSLLLNNTTPTNLSDTLGVLSTVVPATDQPTWGTQLLESAFATEKPIPILETITCAPNSSFTLDIGFGSQAFQCLENLMLWRNTPQDVNSELYQGYRQGNPNNIINEISTGMFWNFFNA
jgi:hypothetical protein